MESADVAPARYVTFASFFLKGPAAQWWYSHRRTLPVGTIITWPDFQAAFRARFIPQGIMDRKKRGFRNLTQGNKTVEAYQREFLDCPAMLKKTLQLMHIDRKSSVTAFKLTSSSHF